MEVEFLGELSLYYSLCVKISASILVGFVIGYDRQVKNKATGLKSNILISLGSCLFTIIGVLNLNPEMPSDPNRILAQIVSGVGFLGAGAIFKGDGEIGGITTAASIWCIAALGGLCGIGYPFVSIVSTILIVILLNILPKKNRSSND
jgi:putative Mg2+ transporter-C (MgtC) family protein